MYKVSRIFMKFDDISQRNPMPQTFAEQVIAFNTNLHLSVTLPDQVAVMNPFQDNAFALPVSRQFYRKYYDDTHKRYLVLGINPGRHGAGLTGVPFTDTKRMEAFCGIPVDGVHSHEPSSEFVYEVVQAYGGAATFYRDFYINSVCPLGFLKQNSKGKWVNYNYYDSKALTQAVEPFILQTLRQQIDFGVYTEKVFCMGSGKNYNYLMDLNEREELFGDIIPLDHPRYIIQYKRKLMPQYIDRWVELLGMAGGKK